MPNLPVELGRGTIGLSAENLSDAERKKVETALSPLGTLHWVDESKIDGISSLSGAGPAIIAIILESMIDAGVRMGLTAHESRTLAIETIIGTAEMMKDPYLSPSEVKWRVASPGGITIRGIQELESQGLRGALIDTFLKIYTE
jgi:pyrroline-5-carboxylate reductase